MDSRRIAHAGLTDREHEILDLLVAGYGNTEIAERLLLTHKTVETHKMHIYLKLQVRKFHELLEIVR